MFVFIDPVTRDRIMMQKLAPSVKLGDWGSWFHDFSLTHEIVMTFTCSAGACIQMGPTVLLVYVSVLFQV